MKKKYIIILSIGIVLMISYLIIFTGTNELPPSKVVEKYDPFFNMLVMPITKYEKGFFTHTFYAQTKVKGKVCDLRFKINYLDHGVTIEDVDKLNERIKETNSKIARPVIGKYDYVQLNEESYFDDIENLTINLRLKEKIRETDRQIIITVSEQCLKFTL
ncbi:hypothetical protein [uncultured Cytophaga sp.]|uniref:hypothetical protein n=1 Tax=uncultured Cytophaga sp. TaxID=160238 RepID=UPI00263060D5|nr:hypothetical protein [uncultured Cytophaga sp.]